MTAPASVTQLVIKYGENHTSSVFLTEQDVFVGVNLESKTQMADEMNKIFASGEFDYFDGFDVTENDIIKASAVSVENEEGELSLWWGGIDKYHPHSFDVYLFRV